MGKGGFYFYSLRCKSTPNAKTAGEMNYFTIWLVHGEGWMRQQKTLFPHKQQSWNPSQLSQVVNGLTSQERPLRIMLYSFVLHENVDCNCTYMGKLFSPSHSLAETIASMPACKPPPDLLTTFTSQRATNYPNNMAANMQHTHSLSSSGQQWNVSVKCLPEWCRSPQAPDFHQTWSQWCSRLGTGVWRKWRKCHHPCRWCRCRCHCRWAIGYGRWLCRCQPQPRRRWWRSPCWRAQSSRLPLSTKGTKNVGCG